MSQGMILAGSADNVLALCVFDREVPPGAKAT